MKLIQPSGNIAEAHESIVDLADLTRQPEPVPATRWQRMQAYLTSSDRRLLRRLPTYFICAAYFAVLPLPPLFLPTFVLITLALIWFVLTSFHRSPFIALAQRGSSENRITLMDLAAAHAAWLCDPVQPSPILLIIPIVMIVSGFQKGLAHFRFLLVCIALSLPTVFLTRSYLLGLEPAAVINMAMLAILLGCIYGTLKNIDSLNKKAKSKTDDLELANHRFRQIGKALQESEARYRSIFENSSTAMCLIDGQMRLSLVNSKFEELTRYHRNELYHQKRLTDFIFRADLDRIKRFHARRKQLGGLAPAEYECQFVDKHQNIHHVIIKFSVIPWHERITASIIDITARKQAKLALSRSYQQLRKAAAMIKHSEHRYRNLFENTGAATILVGKNLRISMANTEFAELTGCPKKEINGTKFLSEFIERKSFNRIKRYQARQKQKGLPLPNEYECIIIDRRRNRKHVIMKIYSPPHQKNSSIVSFFDITVRKKAQTALQEAHEKLRMLADIDELTQIGNRRRFDEQLNREWNRLKREGQPLSLIMSDVDCFKLYNDTYGHQKGDKCLRAIARAISKQVKRSIDQVARYGGEEFAIILPNTNSHGAVQVAEAINQSVEQLKIPNSASTVSDHITLSLGVSTLIPKNGRTPDELVAYADRALYEAKRQGRNRSVFSHPEEAVGEFPMQPRAPTNSAYKH